ncbi:peptidase S16 [Pelagibius litoralis]|uniref:Peptidase S16 n=1 Tax=Pelagibius litoralis TaxID=374515 RepID=A0A967F0Z0_9PROT|nr:LON peptidase substrate-binding domain-containing protein [Pelagibius litoralis]NIA71014.1 peptidase S16 [Pelagibius litoralis]
MSRTAFDPDFDDLPQVLPVFPLGGVLLLPGGRLPLNIFEPRYLAMFDDAMASNRLIGMIQPVEDGEESDVPKIYETGCAGRITSFNETDDGRYLVTLSGLIRFDLQRELPGESYRMVEPNYERFRGDMEEDTAAIDRERLVKVLGDYFEANSIEGDWEAIEQTGDERLVTSLAMICPLAAPEKQALLEAMGLTERAETLTAIMEMATHGGDGESEAKHH